MAQLIVLELGRILRRPLVRAAWAGMLVLFLLSGPFAIMLEHRSFTDDGRLVEGWQAVQLERRRAAPLNTVWTKEKVDGWLDEMHTLLADPANVTLYSSIGSFRDRSLRTRSIYYNNYFSLFDDFSWPGDSIPVLSVEALIRLEQYMPLERLLSRDDTYTEYGVQSLRADIWEKPFRYEWNEGLSSFFQIVSDQGMVLWMALLAALGTLGCFCTDRTSFCLDTLRASRLGQAKLALARMAAVALYGAGCALVWCGAVLAGCVAVFGAGGWNTPAFTLLYPSYTLFESSWTGGQLVLTACGMALLGCTGCAVLAAFVSSLCRSLYGAFFLAAVLALLFLFFSSIGSVEGPVTAVRTVGMCNPLSLVIFQNILFYAQSAGQWYPPAVCVSVAAEMAGCCAGAVRLHCRRP